LPIANCASLPQDSSTWKKPKYQATPVIKLATKTATTEYLRDVLVEFT